MIAKLFTASVILLYLGVGVLFGAAIVLIKGNANLALGIGGALGVIAVGIYAFCLWKSPKAESESKAIES